MKNLFSLSMENSKTDSDDVMSTFLLLTNLEEYFSHFSSKKKLRNNQTSLFFIINDGISASRNYERIVRKMTLHSSYHSMKRAGQKTYRPRAENNYSCQIKHASQPKDDKAKRNFHLMRFSWWIRNFSFVYLSCLMPFFSFFARFMNPPLKTTT